jgi:hypothetical protein
MACDVDELLLEFTVPFSFLSVCTFGLDGESLETAHGRHVGPNAHPAEHFSRDIRRELGLEIIDDLACSRVREEEIRQQVNTDIKVVTLFRFVDVNDSHFQWHRISFVGPHCIEVCLLSHQTIFGVDDVAPTTQTIIA